MVQILGIPDESLFDESLAIEIRGLDPLAQVRLVLETRDENQILWRSEARFTAVSTGDLDLRHATPDEGSSYDLPHPMGLFWSMRSELDPPQRFAKKEVEPLQYHLQVESLEGQVLAEQRFARRLIAVDVRMEMLAPETHEGLAGEFYYPLVSATGAAHRSVVLVFGGSGGGLSFARITAAGLASRGYPALALAYFAYPGRPEAIHDIGLEYFHAAMKWLRQRAGNPKAKLTVLGGSRGGELALLLGSTYSTEVDQVVARVPSHVVWGGFGPKLPEGREPYAWTYKGRGIEFVPMDSTPVIRERFVAAVKAGKPFAVTPLFQLALENEEACAGAAIPVEKCRGRILLISSEDDQMWPSTYFSECVVDRMRRHGFEDRVEHVSYPNAGHTVPHPFLPATVHVMTHAVDGHLYKMGGTDDGDARAAEDSWQRILEFLA